MKKINIWIITAVLLAVVVNPDESNLFGVLTLWGNVVAALCTKGILYSNQQNKNPYDEEEKTTD